jgi:thioredoxin reductase (NADPH)
VPGEEKLMGRGVSHCASYDGQVVGVVGGGDSALQEALTLANFAEQVLLFHNSEKFTAQNSYRKRVLDNSKIIPRYQSAIEEILGDDVVSGVRVRNVASGEISQVDLAGLFVYVVCSPTPSFCKVL